MRKRDFKDLLRKFRKGELNEIDRHLVDSWYDSFGYSESIKPLQDKTNADRIQSNLRSVLAQHTAKHSKIKIFKLWHYAAACVFFAVAFSVFYKLVQTQNSSLDFDTVRAQNSKLVKIKLPDSSEVWLNAGGVVRYASATFNKHRIIYLDEGEAFFKVTKDPKRPFEVHTPKLFTRVLGTSFNVKAYRELNYTSVLVKTGRVRVTIQSEKTGPIITANQGLKYDDITGALNRNDSSAEQSGDWINGDIALHEASFKEMALILFNRYNLRISADNPELLKYHYTINILPNRSLDGALQLICSIHNNHYRRTQNEIIMY